MFLSVCVVQSLWELYPHCHSLKVNTWTEVLPHPPLPTDTHTHTLTHLCLSVSDIQRAGFLSTAAALCLWEGRQLCKVTVWLCNSPGQSLPPACSGSLKDSRLSRWYFARTWFICINRVFRVSVAWHVFTFTLLLASVLSSVVLRWPLGVFFVSCIAHSVVPASLLSD